jgi:hypothetical protein
MQNAIYYSTSIFKCKFVGSEGSWTNLLMLCDRFDSWLDLLQCQETIQGSKARASDGHMVQLFFFCPCLFSFF